MSHHRTKRTACIVDGDNITGGGQLAVTEVARVFQRLSDLTRGFPVTFAMQRRLVPTYMTAYVGLGWGIRFASMAPDAADLELLEAAEDYLTHEVSNLVVVSGDHAFVDLAAHARLHVVAYRRSLSSRLRLAASTVRYLDDLVPGAA